MTQRARITLTVLLADGALPDEAGEQVFDLVCADPGDDAPMVVEVEGFEVGGNLGGNSDDVSVIGASLIELGALKADGSWELLHNGCGGEQQWVTYQPSHHLASVAEESGVFVLARPRKP
jgi:hypothetical protein